MADRKRRRSDVNEENDEETVRNDQSRAALAFKKRLKPDSVILASIKEFSETAQEEKPEIRTLTELNLPHAFREVIDLDGSAVEREIEKTILQITSSILAGNGFGYNVPARGNANQLYVPELDRIVLKDKSSFRQFANVSSVRKTAITTKILQLIHQLCLKHIHVTKRDLFYTDVKLFQDQGQSASVLDDVSCMLGCSEKGVVVGRLIFSDNGDIIDCTKMGVGGKAIPPNIDRVGDMESDALFILLVEKDAAFMRLAEDRFYNRLPMTEQDIKTGKDLLEEDFVKKNPGWVDELEIMVKTKQKAEIQALSSFGFQYLSEVYLPLKIQQRDWI